MNEGVKILLERMKTNPEEFVPEYDGGVTKWGSVIGHYRTYLEAEDNKALEDAWRKTVAVAMQKKFTAAVMKELLAPEEDGSLGKPWYSKQGNITLSGGTTQGGFTLNTNPLNQILQAHREVRQKQKKHKTLFGKLFNYT